MSIALTAGLALAALYLALFHRPASWLRTTVKTAATLCLAAAAYMSGAEFLAAALLACALGDAALSRENDTGFLIGMAAFALGHILLTLLMIQAPSVIPPARLAGMAAIGALALSTRIWLLPYTAHFRTPVRAYVVFILAMGMAAATLPFAMWPAILGAGLFIASDLMLAVEKFRLDKKSRAIGAFIWISYYLALTGFLIVFT